MKKICISVISLWLLFACQPNELPPNLFSGKIKSLQIFDSINNSTYKYTFYYSTNGSLSEIKKDDEKYITISNITPNSILIQRISPTLDTTNFKIVHDNQNKVTSFEQKLDTIHYPFVQFYYNSGLLDSIVEAGVFPSSFFCFSSDFRYSNGNCEYFTTNLESCYIMGGCYPVRSNSYFNHNTLPYSPYVPCQEIQFLPNLYGVEIADCLSLSYISGIFGLTSGHRNNFLILGTQTVSYAYKTDSLNRVIEMSQKDNRYPFPNLLNKAYTLEYYD